MKKRFKYIYGMLATVCLMLIIVGCSPDTKTSNGGNDQQGDDGTKPITIEYRHVNSADWGGNAVKEIVENFNNSQDKIIVEEKYTPDQYQGVMQKVQSGISGGNPPDVAQIGYNFLTFVQEGIPFMPIEEIAALDESEPNFMEDNFLENIIDLSRSQDGTLVGLSYGLSNPVLYYNADMLKEVEWDPDSPPETWDEVKELSELIKEKTGNYGIYIQEPPDNWAHFALAKSNGGDWTTIENGKAKAVVNSPEVIEAYEMAGDFVLDGIGLHANQEEGQQAFGNGKVAMYYTTIGKSTGIKEQSNFDLRTTKSPTFGDKPRSIPAGGNSLVIFSQDPEKQKASWEFIKYLQSPEALQLWVEGTGYLPPREGVAEDPDGLKEYLESNELMKAAIEQMDSTVQWANFPGDNGLEAEQALIDARDQILTGRKTATEALNEAAEKIDNLIQ